MNEVIARPMPAFGWSGFALGAAALFLALTIFWAGPFAPQQSLGVSLGELAAEIGKSALRSSVGLAQPEPQAKVRDIDDYLKIAVAALGVTAIVAASVGLIRREAWRPAVGAIALGGSALLFQLFTFLVLAFIGALIIMALLDNFSDIFGSVGLFGD